MIGVCLSLHWSSWMARCGSVGGGGLEVGVRDTFSQCSASFRIPHRPGFVFSPVPQGEGSGGGDSVSAAQRCSRACVSFSKFLQSHVCGHQVSGGWRPIIDLSTLNLSVVKTRFQIEATQSILRSVQRNDWMVFISLKDAYLQTPIHPSSRRYLRFTAGGRAWQFKVLCFSLSTAPQAFTRVMVPVSSFLHQSGVRMLQYLDDWLILVSSRKDAC